MKNFCVHVLKVEETLTRYRKFLGFRLVDASALKVYVLNGASHI